MPKKCAHKGCGKTYTDDNEECVYHPGPPEFHEGQKGWKCCKPRVLTFDEFLSIPPCTTGTHSDLDDTPQPEPAKPSTTIPQATQVSLDSLQKTLPLPPPQAATPRPAAPSPAPPEESDSDEEGAEIPPGQSCKRKGCNGVYGGGEKGRGEEECVHHPGSAVFHEGSKGWSCCKRRVLEFDEFMRIPGCRTKGRHLFVGRKGGRGEEERVESVRHDFYQTPTTVIASLFLKKISLPDSTISFTPTHVNLDLRTSDSKRYNTELPLYATIDPDASAFKVMGTKLELTLRKAEGGSWPVLRKDERLTGEILQVGKAVRV